MNKDGSVFIDLFLALVKIFDSTLSVGPEGEGSGGGGVLPYMGYIGMCRCEIQLN